MKNKLLNILTLQEDEIVSELLKLDTKKTISFIELDNDLNNKFILFVYNLAQKHFEKFNQKCFSTFEFAKSPILVNFLSPEFRGKIFSFCNSKQNFKASYNCSIYDCLLEKNIKEYFEGTYQFELSRLDDKQTTHLNDNYVDYLIKNFKPNISKENYYHFMFCNFVLSVRLGKHIQQYIFLDENNLIFGKELSGQYKIIHSHLSSCNEIINKFKQELFFNDWNEDLKRKFEKDLKTPNPYAINFSGWKDEVNDFKKLLPFFDLILLKNNLNDTLKTNEQIIKKNKV